MRKIKMDNTKIIDEILKLETPIEFMADFFKRRKIHINYFFCKNGII